MIQLACLSLHSPLGSPTVWMGSSLRTVPFSRDCQCSEVRKTERSRTEVVARGSGSGIRLQRRAGAWRAGSRSAFRRACSSLGRGEAWPAEARRRSGSCGLLGVSPGGRVAAPDWAGDASLDFSFSTLPQTPPCLSTYFLQLGRVSLGLTTGNLWDF